MSRKTLSLTLQAQIDRFAHRAFRGALRIWYKQYQRDLPWRRTSDPYAIWVSEVMLQQTQVKTALPYYQRFMSLFPDVAHLAAADLQQILKAWEGLGYYSRARNLHKSAQMITLQMDGRIPSDWDGLRQLPGVGDYIASAVLSIAFGRPYAVLDGNVKRVLARLLCLDDPINATGAHKVYQPLATSMLDTKHPGDHNQAMMELGATVCTPRQPECPQCPVSRFCRAFQSEAIDHYPQRVARRTTPEHHLVAGVIYKKGRILMTQRPAHGLLGGLWEFPNGPLQPGDVAPQACVRLIRAAVNLDTVILRPLDTVRHAYTHFKIRMQVFDCRWQAGRVRLDGPAAFQWVAPTRIHRLALHGAMHKVLSQLVKQGNFS